MVRPKCKWTVYIVRNFRGVCAGPSGVNRGSFEGRMLAKPIYIASRCQYILVTRLWRCNGGLTVKKKKEKITTGQNAALFLRPCSHLYLHRSVVNSLKLNLPTHLTATPTIKLITTSFQLHNESTLRTYILWSVVD